MTKGWVGLAVWVTTRIKHCWLAHVTHNMNANGQCCMYKLATVKGELNQRHKLAWKKWKMCKHFLLLALFGCCVNIYPKYLFFLLWMRAMLAHSLPMKGRKREKQNELGHILIMHILRTYLWCSEFFTEREGEREWTGSHFNYARITYLFVMLRVLHTERGRERINQVTF